jgi:hypothetical protein
LNKFLILALFEEKLNKLLDQIKHWQDIRPDSRYPALTDIWQGNLVFRRIPDIKKAVLRIRDPVLFYPLDLG